MRNSQSNLRTYLLVRQQFMMFSTTHSHTLYYDCFLGLSNILLQQQKQKRSGLNRRLVKVFFILHYLLCVMVELCKLNHIHLALILFVILHKPSMYISSRPTCANDWKWEKRKVLFHNHIANRPKIWQWSWEWCGRLY